MTAFFPWFTWNERVDEFTFRDCRLLTGLNAGYMYDMIEYDSCLNRLLLYNNDQWVDYIDLPPEFLKSFCPCPFDRQTVHWTYVREDEEYLAYIRAVFRNLEILEFYADGTIGFWKTPFEYAQESDGANTGWTVPQETVEWFQRLMMPKQQHDMMRSE